MEKNKEIDPSDYRARIYEKYAANFMDSPETFDELEARKWGKGYRHYLRHWLPTDKNASIVDLACGSGRLLYLFKQMGYQNISGIDISPDQIELAAQVIPTVYQANILEWLQEKPSSFDLITGLDIIEHFHKPEVLEFLDTCFLALKPGGRIILQTPNCESIWGSMHRYYDFTHEVGFTNNSLSRLLKTTGFNRIETREIGPVPWGYSFISTCRFFIWQVIRAGLKIWNLAETGSIGSGILTRIFLISGSKN